MQANQLAGGLGFEPRLAESKSAVLPLDDPPMFTNRINEMSFTVVAKFYSFARMFTPRVRHSFALLAVRPPPLQGASGQRSGCSA